VVQGSIQTFYILCNFSPRGLFLDSIIGGYVLACLLLHILVQSTVSVPSCWYVKHTRMPRVVGRLGLSSKG